MPIDRYFKLYLNAGRSIPLVINANQYDSGETWYFTLYTDRGEVYLPSSGAIIGIKADGHIIDNAATVDSRGRVVVTETEQMTAASGKSVFELSIDGNTHGTANFMLLVEPKPSDGGVLSDSDLSLLQEAIDSTSPAAIAEGVSDWMDEHLAPGEWVIDDTLTVQGAAADAKKTGDEIADLKSAIEQGSSLTSAIKSALLQIAQKVAYIDEDGQTYYDDLYDALYPPIVITAITLNTNSLSFATLNSTQQLTATTTPSGGEVTWTSSNTSVATVSQTGVVTSVSYGNATITATSGSVSATCSVTIAQATVTSISAVYTQNGTVYDTDSLDSLKSDLVVTATWSNQTTSTVASADYTLSGTLTVGTSTITVSYAGETTTFNVTVSKAMYSAINITDIPWTSGYTINSNGELEADANYATWNSFISGDYGTGFMYLKNGSNPTNNLTISEYDTNESFLSKTVNQRCNFAKNQSSKFIKVTVSNSLISDYDLTLVGVQRVPDSVLTLTNTTLDNSGNTATQSGRKCSDFIDISTYQFAYAMICQIASGAVLCFYDSSKTFISRHASSSAIPTLMNVPANAKYIRIACSDAVSSFLL